MIDVLCADMYAKNLISKSFTWWVSYDYKSLEDCPGYEGPVVIDFYGRLHPKHNNGTVRLAEKTNSVETITAALLAQFDKKTDHRLLYRRLGVNADYIMTANGSFQLNLFTDYDALDKERRIQGAMLEVRKKYGPNSIVKGMNLLEGATTIERNGQIGGHNRNIDS